MWSIINAATTYNHKYPFLAGRYDTEINLYCLNSHYYNPETSWFINADDPSYFDESTI